MSLVNPLSTDTLASDNHTLMHNAFSIDSAAPANSCYISSSGDVSTYNNGWTDYSGTSTITGMGTFTTKFIYTKRIGKTVFVNYSLAGTSSATTVTFTLPYALGTPSTFAFIAIAQTNAGANVVSIASFTASIVTCYATVAAGNFTNGTSQGQGQFWYQSS